MKMRIKEGKFYVLDAKMEKWVHDTEDSAIESLKELVSQNKDLAADDITIWEVNTEGEEWEIKGVPWSKIAVGLIRG